MPLYTVNSLLQQAGRSRGKRHSSRQGYDVDHIVELQLVVAALNSLQSEYSKESLGILVDFFNSDSNLMEVPAVYNRQKGQAVTRLIWQRQSVQGDNYYIQTVRDHWYGELEGKLQNFKRFKEKLNAILG